ncbi:bifunctional peptidase and arginyl-hydroxylase JMJD5 isoform X2 [Phymastichus coffea]|uniref:bifunctional peptidase and arginyl-hydroxylase JMJD5 isoform X2 n=1 Tax=Phymastichus coffea TaxID=108790 RepID=UPI00273A9077|nr:bifunctional peptidase and arginyl-hydroxylase JMJD5 isoform X2 [Phymastichus coffea]
MFSQIVMKSVSWDLLLQDLNSYFPNELKFHLVKILLKLKSFHKHTWYAVKKKLKINEEWIKNDLLIVDACLDRTWEMLNSGYWKDVPIIYRYCYSLCCVIKSAIIEVSIESENSEMSEKFKDIIQQIDKGLLLGAPLPSCPKLLTEIASNLNNHYSDLVKNREIQGSRITIDKKNFCTDIFPGFLPIPTFRKPSMERFYRDIFKPKTPALLQNCIEHWQALSLWKDIEYLRKVAGSRTVPIEIGSRYTEDDWTQSLITFSEFLNAHISKKNEQVGYLAQHELFDQIPELKNDFTIPDYCSFSDKDDGEYMPNINAWFGPEGTVSPLHHDPKNNLLCQVFGCKRVILYSPKDSLNLYPYNTRLLSNTAQIDPYNADVVKYPDFQKARGFMCYLTPGDILFIPPKWWHHIVGLSTSFSVSFWWD